MRHKLNLENFPCTQQLQHPGILFPHVLGRLGPGAGVRVWGTVWPGRPWTWSPSTKLLSFPVLCGHPGGHPAADRRKRISCSTNT